MRTISPKELTAGKETEGQRQLLMFGSRNWRSKSRKEHNYAPRLENSWLRHCLTRYSPMAWYSIFVLKVPLNTNQPTYAFARVRLSVCLSVNKITQKHVLDLEFMLHVDRCRDMDELINFWADPDYRPAAGTELLSPISSVLQHRILLRGENPTYAYWRGRSLHRGVVLKWFYSPRAVGTPLSEVNALCRLPSSFDCICCSCMLCRFALLL